MSFPTVAAVNGGNQVAADVTSHTVNLPASIAANDLLLGFFTSDGDPVITWPGDWTLLFETVTGTAARFSCYYKIASGSEGASITVTTDVNEKSAHTTYRIGVGSFTGTPEAGTSATGTSTTPNPPSLSPSWGANDALWIAALGYDRGDRRKSVV